MAPKMKNWSRDELILALNLYFERPPAKISHDHPAVIELSDILNKLAERLGRISNEKFRSPNGVHMKLCNFLRREYKGKGLQAGGRLEEAVWKQFSNNREELGVLARAITTAVKGDARSLVNAGDNIDEEEFSEGAILYRTHLSLERNRELIRRAKARAIARLGRLVCQACGFDFLAVYGQIGEGFVECHHTIPVSELNAKSTTRLQDVALLCSNCHRMLHRRRPWLRMDDLRKLVAGG